MKKVVCCDGIRGAFSQRCLGDERTAMERLYKEFFSLIGNFVTLS